MHNGKKAIIYTRISQDRSGEGLGVQRQEEECRRYADREGMQVVEILTDNDISGYKGKLRPAFEQLKRSVEARDVDAVIYWKQDRITRQQHEFWHLVELCKPSGKKGDVGVTLHAPGDTAAGYVDLTTSGGLLNAGMGALLSQHTGALMRDRALSKFRQKAAAGEWLGGTRPFGWNIAGRRLELNDEEATAVQAACRDLLAGRSLGSIIRQWNDENRPGGPLRTSLGKPWGYAQLRQVLLRERNTGRVTVDPRNGEPPIVMECPPILTESEWKSVVGLLKDPARRRSQSNKARHLLAGIAQCHCGQLVKSATTMGRPNKVTGERAKRMVYRCPAKGPGHVGKGIEYVDTIAELFVFQLLKQDVQAQASDPVRVARRQELEVQLADLERRKTEAGTLVAEGEMEPSQLAAFNRSMNEQMSPLLAELDELGAAPVEDLGDATDVLRTHALNDEAFRQWRQSPIDERRDFVRSRLHVVLRPHRVGSPRDFDPDTVSVYPRRRNEHGPLSAEEVEARPLTPLVSGPDSGNAHDESRWVDYLNNFMWRSGFGWPSGLRIELDHMDGRADFKPRWRGLDSA
ncbi:recombinase family protein [Citricoccus nitrophenolicus]|uniref:recombinase family protein n=1 Tax=Citricoccus nitrophenolicus TaxID=863575 RepID=UPI0039B3D312